MKMRSLRMLLDFLPPKLRLRMPTLLLELSVSLRMLLEPRPTPQLGSTLGPPKSYRSSTRRSRLVLCPSTSCLHER